MVQKLMGILGRCGYIRGAHALEGRGSCQYTIEAWVQYWQSWVQERLALVYGTVTHGCNSYTESMNKLFKLAVWKDSASSDTVPHT